MTRERLLTAIEMVAEQLGYTPFTGNDLQLTAKINELPLIWFSPLKIVATEGYRDCRVTYAIKAKMLMLSEYNEISCEATWQILEKDALAFYRNLSEQNWVQNVSNFICTPSSLSATPNGDISVIMEFNAEMFYCI